MLKEKMSYSFASKLLSKQFEQIKYELENPTPPTESMEDGSRIDYCLANGLDKLKVLDHKRRDAKYKAEKQDIIENNEFYRDNPYLICLENKRKELEVILSHLTYQVKQLFKKGKTQTYFTLDNFDVPVHGVTDLETDDCVYELKFSDSNEDKFRRQVVNFNYHIQAFLYHTYAQQTGRDFKWLVISPTPPHVQRIYHLCDSTFIDVGETDFMAAIELFKEFNRDEPVSIEMPLDSPKWW